MARQELILKKRPPYRYMDGERFRLQESGLTEAIAIKLASRIRGIGKKLNKRYLARVMPGAKGTYQVWWSPHDWFAR